MANYFVDSTTGNNENNGATTDLAWATIEHAVESGGLSAGDIVWVRRTHVEYSGNPTSDIQPAYGGTYNNWIKVIGWPRGSVSLSKADWTNGSATVDNVVGATLSREAHAGRYVTAPNGKRYVINYITDSNTFIIDREYSGATVTDTDGACAISADEDYALAQSIDDSAWTIKLSTWTADPHAVPCIDFKNTAYNLYLITYHYWSFRNLEFRDSGDDYGIVWLRNYLTEFKGCLFHQDQNKVAFTAYSLSAILNRCNILGSGSGTAQHGVRVAPGGLIMIDTAINKCGGYGLYCDNVGIIQLDNVNIGVEVANSNHDVFLPTAQAFLIRGRDVKLGGTNGTLRGGLPAMRGISGINIENYGKVLGAHFAAPSQYYGMTNTAVVAGSGDPQKRINGADEVVEITCNGSSVQVGEMSELSYPILSQEYFITTAGTTITYYVQCYQMSTNADELWIEAEYVDSYDDTTEYTIMKLRSNNSCAERSGAADWSQYLSVTLTPATESKVRVTIYINKYDADGKLYIDPNSSVT